MRNRRTILGIAAALVTAAAAFAVPAATTLSAAPPAVSSLSVHQVSLVDFSGGTHEDNVKIESYGDDGCLSYAHPVASTTLGVVPCNGSHNFNVYISPDGTQEVWAIPGTSLAVGDQSGEITTKAFNMTSDSLYAPSGHPGCGFNKTIGGHLVQFFSIAFAESNPNNVFIEASNGLIVASSACNVHTAWAVVSG